MHATVFVTGNKVDVHPSENAGMICAPLMTSEGSIKLNT